MEWWQLIIYGAAGLGLAVLSGISGGGGGFIMTPLAILLGLSPAQAISTGKFNGLAIALGSLGGLRAHRGTVHKGKIIAIILLTFAVGLTVPHIIKSFESSHYQLMLGIILLLMIPVIVYKKIGLHPHRPTPLKKGLGGVLLALSLFLQGVFSGGLGTLVNVVLMGMLGQTALEANITKRWSQVVLNVTIILGVLTSGLIVWPVMAVGTTSAMLGGYVGGHMAVRKGNKFAMDVTLAMMGLAGVYLVATAL